MYSAKTVVRTCTVASGIITRKKNIEPIYDAGPRSNYPSRLSTAHAVVLYGKVMSTTAALATARPTASAIAADTADVAGTAAIAVVVAAVRSSEHVPLHRE